MKRPAYYFFLVPLFLNSVTSFSNEVFPWSSPDWGFVRNEKSEKGQISPHQVIDALPTQKKVTDLAPTKHKLANSLFFDQPFDKNKVFPLPEKSETTQQLTNEKIGSEESPLDLLATLKFAPKENPYKLKKLDPIKTNAPKVSPPVPVPQKPIQAVVANSSIKIAEKLNPPQVPTLPTATPLTKIDSPRLGKLLTKNWARSALERGHIKVVDEETLTLGEPRAIEGIEISWMGNENHMELKPNEKWTNDNGIALVPTAMSHSARFIAKAKGYIPAVGYAWSKNVTPVVMYRESKIPSVAQGILKKVTDKLQTFPYPNSTIVFGKVIDSSGAPIEGVWMDTNLSENHEIFYSTGSFGIFHPQQKTTGVLGEFLVSGMQMGYKPLTPTKVGNLFANNGLEPVESSQNSVNLPSHFIDFSGVGPIASVTLVDGQNIQLETTIVDHTSNSYPEGLGILANLGGEKTVPDTGGNVVFSKVPNRPNVEFVQVNSLSKDYYLKNTLLNITTNPLTMPDAVTLFSTRNLYSAFQDISYEVNFERPVIIGRLRPEHFTEAVAIEVVDYRGKTLQGVPTFYAEKVDEEMIINRELKQTSPDTQTFILGNLVPGEYHIQARRVRDRKILATQITRTLSDSISLVQF